MYQPTLQFDQLYHRFNLPIIEQDCGKLCSPYNPNGKPFCCDICYSIPVAYMQEWEFLHSRTDLWHRWRGDECLSEPSDPSVLEGELPEHMCFLACKGPADCQREYRSVSCRQFPFFPYITADDRFIGLAYHWDFEPYCWIISHLKDVTLAFRKEFVRTYDTLLSDYPADYDSYYYLSEDMRDHFLQEGRQIPILHRDSGYYLLDPSNDQLKKVLPDQFLSFGPYQTVKG